MRTNILAPNTGGSSPASVPPASAPTPRYDRAPYYSFAPKRGKYVLCPHGCGSYLIPPGQQECKRREGVQGWEEPRLGLHCGTENPLKTWCCEECQEAGQEVSFWTHDELSKIATREAQSGYYANLSKGCATLRPQGAVYLQETKCKKAPAIIEPDYNDDPIEHQQFWQDPARAMPQDDQCQRSGVLPDSLWSGSIKRYIEEREMRGGGVTVGARNQAISPKTQERSIRVPEQVDGRVKAIALLAHASVSELMYHAIRWRATLAA